MLFSLSVLLAGKLDQAVLPTPVDQLLLLSHTPMFSTCALDLHPPKISHKFVNCCLSHNLVEPILLHPSFYEIFMTLGAVKPQVKLYGRPCNFCHLTKKSLRSNHLTCLLQSPTFKSHVALLPMH